MGLDNISIPKKLSISPAVLITILIAMAVVSSNLLGNLANDMKKISFDLAPDTELAAELTDAVYGLRLTVKNYIKTGDDKFISKFNDQASLWSQDLEQAYKEIQNPERVALLKSIEGMKTEYLNTFTGTVISNMRSRNELVQGTLNVNGPEIERKLTQVMDSAKSDATDVRPTSYWTTS